MHDLVREVFHGHLRSIIGGLSVEDLIANRNELAQADARRRADEMQKLGLVVDSLQIQEIVDPTGYIKALGEPRAAEVEDARPHRAGQRRPRGDRARAGGGDAEGGRAARHGDQAGRVPGGAGSRRGDAAQAGPLADAEARKQVVVQETAVAELEAQREERRLDSQVRKPADAAAYQARVEAEGQREARIALAEASKRETELAAEADARKVELARRRTPGASSSRPRRGQADARGRRGRGGRTTAGARPRARAVRASGLAEAESIAKRAEALERESDAVIGQQLAEKLPEIVAAAAGAFGKVDNLTVLNGAQGMGEIMNQIIGQAGPALTLARDTLGRNKNGGSVPDEKPVSGT